MIMEHTIMNMFKGMNMDILQWYIAYTSQENRTII